MKTLPQPRSHLDRIIIDYAAVAASLVAAEQRGREFAKRCADIRAAVAAAEARDPAPQGLPF